jgi:hypothetical protein
MWLGTHERPGPGLAAFLNTSLVSTKVLTQESWNAAWEKLMEKPGA